MKENMFEYADRNRQIKSVNKFLCFSTAILYVLSYVINIVSFLQGNRTIGYMAFVLVIMLGFTIGAFVIYRKNKQSTFLRYFTLIGVVMLVMILAYSFSDYYVRFLAALPVLAGILFFDTKYMSIAALLVSVGNFFATIYRGFILKNYEGDALLNNFVASAVVMVMVCIAAYLTKMGKAFNNDSLGKVQYEADLQSEMTADVLRIANQVKTETTDAMERIDELLTSTETVHRSMSDISEGTMHTAESIQTQSTNTQNIQEHLNQTMERVEAMVRVAERSNELNMQNAEKMKRLSAETQVLSDNNDAVAEAMKQLQQNVTNVKAITQTIFSISSQTNLLALNASIESARAGEAGRGFAVVADEIRLLSEKTRQETENISKILDDLTADANKTAAAVELSVDTGNIQEEMIVDVAGQFAEMNENVNKLVADIEEIQGVIANLTNANTEIVDSIDTLSAVTEEVTASAQQSTEMTEHNFNNAKQTQELLGDILKVCGELDKYLA